MNKTIDLINALNEHDHIKEIELCRKIKAKSLVEEYEKLLSLDKTEMAYDIKKYINWFWEMKDKEILKYKSDYLQKELEVEQYNRKLDYMVNGCNVKEMFNEVFSKNSRAARGYLIVSQHDEQQITDDFTTMRDLVEIKNLMFTVFRASEIDLNKRPFIGEVLYSIGSNGNLKKIRGNYDSSD